MLGRKPRAFQRATRLLVKQACRGRRAGDLAGSMMLAAARSKQQATGRQELSFGCKIKTCWAGVLQVATCGAANPAGLMSQRRWAGVTSVSVRGGGWRKHVHASGDAYLDFRVQDGRQTAGWCCGGTMSAEESSAGVASRAAGSFTVVCLCLLPGRSRGRSAETRTARQ
ncbi:hypothetical protein BDV95DRAFT_389306 [Massariosphaeria phaeospora]|uniref:Uncharacterized protein n=1 Tax=Massariosphaeria phaeospora TaxID=100035 RepID=A0A7C8I7E4_9PLEO|nr:hypothetical protein BDV95DRAFT_389306 [Massariosphaeria phaeospora]